ncbi:MAG: hypothetical protein ABIU05_21970 [Nitrospirales bacterium]
MDPLDYETVQLTVSRRVIAAVPLATYGADHAVFTEFVLEGLAGLLAALIRVMQQLTFPPLLHHGQRS